ncbi:MAG: hypothetical protein JWM06_2231 [Actinomycetia bacterium]|nr:hypothetical protein [Actinomycetes bacterium]
MSGALLSVEHLTKEFHTNASFGRRAEVVRALDDVSFEVRRGETFGLVGESGSGKSTLARCVLRLIEPTAGRITFDGIDLRALDAKRMRRLRRRLQFVFQDASGALDPRMNVGELLAEPLEIHGVGDRNERRRRGRETLELVGLTNEMMDRRPHEFSGGQRQRVGIARALVLRPEVVVLDEPISALDVSVQAQVLNLLRDLQRELGLTYVFIGHDLAVAEYFCDRVAVLYLGHQVESASREQLFSRPLHPYTVGLFEAAPVPDPSRRSRQRRTIVRDDADMPSPLTGCPLQPRCPVGRHRKLCATTRPPLEEHEPRHVAACHFPGALIDEHAAA